MTLSEEYEQRKFDASSGFEINERSGWASLHQEFLGQPITGVWSEEDEAAWAKKITNENWNLIMQIMDFPANWDTGPRPDDILLNLEF